MPSTPTSDTDRFMCIAYLLVDVGSRVLRQFLSHHTVTSTCTLDQYLVKNMNTINSLRRVFNQSQMDIMFPPNGDDTNLDEYDITLLSALLHKIVPTLSQQEKDMINRLREQRNKLYGRAKSCQISAKDFQTNWNDISSILTTLSQQCGDTAFEAMILQEIQHTKVSAIPAGSSIDILKTWLGKIETVESVLQNMTTRLLAVESREKSSATSAGAMPSPLTSDTDRFMCIAYLLVDIGSRVLRQLLSHHTITSTCTLAQYLVQNMNTINSNRRVFNQPLLDIMFPPNGDDTNLDDYDITLLSDLFQNIVPTLSQLGQNMINRLREERNKLYAHAKSCQISANDFQTYWNDISSTLITLSQQCMDTAFAAKILQEIQRTKVSAVPAGSYLDILNTWFGRIETVEGKIETFEGKIETVEGKIETVECALHNVTTKLQVLESNKKSSTSEF